MNKKEADLLEQLRKLPDNKKCVDCNKKGTTYIITNFGIFTCSTCAGLHRQINHKVKGIGMSTFTPQELVLVKKFGNKNFNQEYMGKHSSVHYPIPLNTDRVKMKNYLDNKYTKKLFYQQKRDNQEDSEQSEEEEVVQKKPSRKSVVMRPAPKARVEEQKQEEFDNQTSWRKRAQTTVVQPPTSLIDFEEAPAPSNAPPHNPTPSLFNAFSNNNQTKTVASNLSGAAQLGWSTLTPQNNPPAQPISQPIQPQQEATQNFTWAKAFESQPKPAAQNSNTGQLLMPADSSPSLQNNLLSFGQQSNNSSHQLPTSGTSTPGIVNSSPGDMSALSTAFNNNSSQPTPSLASLLKTAYSSQSSAQPQKKNNDAALIQQLSVIITQQHQLISQILPQIPHNPQILQLQQGLVQQLTYISSLMSKNAYQNPMLAGFGGAGLLNSGVSVGIGSTVNNDPFASSGTLPTLGGGSLGGGMQLHKKTPVEKKEQELFSDLMQMSSSNGQSSHSAAAPPPSAPPANPHNPFDLLL